MRAGKDHWLYRSSLWAAVLAGIIFWAALGPANHDYGSSAGALGRVPPVRLRSIQIADPGGIGGVGG